jgi:YHS domain-containing protein
MPVHRCRLFTVACVPLLVVTATAQDAALRGFDAVALVGGKELAGKPELTIERGGFRYQFATDENRATFAASPERYEIQFGGACARMGPLTGAGDTGRFHVHAERIYVFASDQCRDGFKKKPEAFLPQDEVAPTPSPDAVAAGKALVRRAAEAHGGAARLQALRTLKWQRSNASGNTTELVRTSVQFPDAARVDQDFVQGDKVWRYARAVAPGGSFFVSQGAGRPMSPSAEREMRRDFAREPLLALRAALDGGAFVQPAGKRTVLGIDVEEVAIWCDGHTTTFGLDAEGRVRTARCRARGGRLWFGAAELRFDDLQPHGGVLVASTVVASFEGTPDPALGERRQEIAVDAELPAGIFTAPK